MILVVWRFRGPVYLTSPDNRVLSSVRDAAVHSDVLTWVRGTPKRAEMIL
ncbi:hypothetical protein HH643_003851 [Escherichia coli]|nr:hypothetical protein [Escherichia coli]EFH1714761.1 hypothetical protein [Escherichia coli]EFI3907167.1 hypothetical protein [Escherichia coli]EFI4670907.1 hypothetical protein [Escherichia coli]EFI5976265.1 hypothetical protein [Escherichia coli]